MQEKPFELHVDKLNPHCGCGDKGWYTLFKITDEGLEVMGSDEFSYKTQQEFDKKVQELAKRYNAAIIIDG